MTEKAVLKQGRVYQATVEVTNKVGLKASASSDGIFIDLEAPLPGKLAWGPTCSNKHFVTSTEKELQLCWHGFADKHR